MLEYLGAFLFFLCWGSFLNVVGYRLVEGTSLLGRSACPHCKKKIAWYDLIPLFSWILLKAQCRACSQAVSVLYPALELLTATTLTALLIYIDQQYWPAYFLFFSALLVTIRTDMEYMLISTYMTLFMIPFGFALSALHMLPISLFDSLLGAATAYCILWTIAHSFRILRKKEGLGQGDIELLAMIGAFTGIMGAWIALLLGALFGSVIGLTLALRTKRQDIAIPFGPWLSLGAIIYVFLQQYFLAFLMD